MNQDKLIIALDNRRAGDDIERELLKSLRSSLPQSLNDSFVLTARANDGSLVGGLSASSSYSWLLIKTLWVDSAYRRMGAGAALLESAEAHAATELGCHAAWLDTSNPDAMQFYVKFGYEVFGQLSNGPGQMPELHRRWFMKKALVVSKN